MAARERTSKENLQVVDNHLEQDLKLVPESATLSGCEIASLYDWDYRVAYAVCMAESGGNSRAYNGSNSNGTNDAGLMQINSIHVDSGLIGDKERFDPQFNMAAAYAIYKGSGFRAWAAYNNQSYTRYL